jgi:threonine dehydrogenase-like Zn-dependent dehydrogenase
MNGHSADRSVPSRAAVFLGDNRARTIDTLVPAPGADEIRVRLEGCGVCASNLPVWEGRSWFQYPTDAGAPGHEGWGTVDALGETVTGFEIGDRVAFLSQNAYAQYDIAGAIGTVKLPASTAGRPFPGEPLGCVMNIFSRSDIRAGQSVAVVGIGFIGAALTSLAVRAGARVIALSRRAFALETARRLGAHHCIELRDAEHAVREFGRIHGEHGCERVIEAIGSQEGLDVASAIAGVRARLVIAGYHQDGARRVDLQRWNWRGLDIVNAHERDPVQYRRGMQEAVERVTSGSFDPASLITHHFPLEEIAGAFDVLARRPDGFLKAWISCA